MLLVIPHRPVISVPGHAFKKATCQNCGQKYVYRVCRIGRATNDSFFTTAAGERRACEKASEKVAKLLEAAVEAAPCPSCGTIQENMYRATRRLYKPWLKWLGVLFFVAGSFSHLILLPWSQKFGLGGLWRVMFSLLGMALAVYIARRVGAARWNPNDSPRTCESLARESRNRGIWTAAEYDQLLAKSIESHVTRLNRLKTQIASMEQATATDALA